MTAPRFIHAATVLAGLALAGGLAAASASAAGLTPARSLGPRPVTYCGPCLCTATPPPMPAAGDWVPNGQFLGGSIVLKFRPAGQPVSTLTACQGPQF